MVRKIFFFLIGCAFVGALATGGFWYFSASSLKDNLQRYISAQEDTSVEKITVVGFDLDTFPSRIALKMENLAVKMHFEADEESATIFFNEVYVYADILDNKSLDFQVFNNISISETGPDGQDLGDIALTFGDMSGTISVDNWKEKFLKKVKVQASGLNLVEISPASANEEVVSDTFSVTIGSLDFTLNEDPRRISRRSNVNLTLNQLSLSDGASKTNIEQASLGMLLPQKDGSIKWEIKNLTSENTLLDNFTNSPLGKLEYLTGEVEFELQKPAEESVIDNFSDAEEIFKAVSLKKFELKFGEAKFFLAGEYDAGETGDFAGIKAQLFLSLAGWQEQLNGMRESGVIDSGLYVTLSTYLERLEDFSNTDVAINLEFKIDEGILYLGNKPLTDIMAEAI